MHYTCDVDCKRTYVYIGKNTYFFVMPVVPPAITSTLSDTVVYTGDPYTARCSATGVPAPIMDGVTVSNGELTVASMTHNNTGPYQYFANNVRPDITPLWVVTVIDPGEYLCNEFFVFSIVMCSCTTVWVFNFEEVKFLWISWLPSIHENY